MPKINTLIHVPGVYKCPKCAFSHHRQVLNLSTGEVGASLEFETLECPNDGTPMVPLTWREDAVHNQQVAIQLLERMHMAHELLMDMRVEEAMHLLKPAVEEDND